MSPSLTTAILLICLLLAEVRGEWSCAPNGTADLLYIFDSSRGVSNATYQKMLGFGANLAENFHLGPNALLISSIIFSEAPSSLFGFNTSLSWDFRNLQHTLVTAPYMGGATNTFLALQEAQVNSFTIAKGARQAAPKVAIVFTDGRSGNLSQTSQQATVLKNLGVRVLVVTSGSANRQELEAIASSPDLIFNVNTDLTKVKNLIQNYSNHECIAVAEECFGVQYADVVIVLDASASIGADNYRKQLSFLINISNSFQIGPSDVQFGLVVFSDTAQVVFNLKDFSHPAAITNAISNAPYLSSGTATDEALDLVTDQAMFSSAAGARTNTSKILIVMTDGRSNSIIQTAASAKRLRNAGIYIIAIGIGDEVNKEELGLIASGNESQFMVAGFEALKTITESISSTICATPPQTTPEPVVCTPNGTADVLFVIDSSSNVSRDSYNKMLTFAANLAENFPYGPDSIQFSAITFSTVPQIIFDFDDYSADDFKTMQHTLVTASYIGRETNTHLALQAAQTNGFKSANGARAGAPKVVIVFTDGHSAHFNQTVEEAAVLKRLGVVVVAVGSGTANKHELQLIASSPADVYNLDSDFAKVKTRIQSQSFQECLSGTSILLNKKTLLCNTRPGIRNRFSSVLLLNLSLSDITPTILSHLAEEEFNVQADVTFVSHSGRSKRAAEIHSRSLMIARFSARARRAADVALCGTYHLPDGIFPDPSNCLNFVQCSGLATHFLECPYGLAYNSKTSACDDTHVVNCNDNYHYYDTIVG